MLIILGMLGRPITACRSRAETRHSNGSYNYFRLNYIFERKTNLFPYSILFSPFGEDVYEIISRRPRGRATPSSSSLPLSFPLYCTVRTVASSLALLRFLLFLRFRRTFFAPSAPSVTAPGQILFPVEFKTLRNTRIYFTGVPRRSEGKRRGFTPDPTRLVNVTKKRCIRGRWRRKRRRKSDVQEGRKREGGREERRA